MKKEKIFHRVPGRQPFVKKITIKKGIDFFLKSAIIISVKRERYDPFRWSG